MWAKEVVDRGGLWRVGNGSKIDVFGDAWVAGLSTGRLRNRGQLGGGVKVERLICEGKEWYRGLLRSFFMAHEVEAICNTPIKEHDEVDELRWRYEESGRFSVKTAYLIQIRYYDESPHSSGRDRKRWSRSVWSLTLPPKVRVFVWRLYHNLLPTANNLERHHVSVDDYYLTCRGKWSTTTHCIVFCPRVRKIWKNSRFWNIMKGMQMKEMEDIGDMIRKECGGGGI